MLHMETYTYEEKHHAPSVCPVCNGKGWKTAAFYGQGSTKERVDCKACYGRGVIIPNCTHVHNHPQPVDIKPWTPPYQTPWWAGPTCETNQLELSGKFIN